MKAKTSIILLIITLAVVITLTLAGVFLFKNLQKSENLKNEYFLSSIYNSVEQYADAFSNLPEQNNDTNIDAGIISHHFLAKELIAEFYNKIGNNKTSTVFLISPDHFNNYFKPETTAYTSSLNWTTPFGELFAEDKIINSLLESENIEINDSVIGLEHGVYVEAPFIKKFFPNAKIVPLVLKNDCSQPEFLALGKSLKKIAGENSILIVSSDFSHEVSADQASINDSLSIDALKNINTDNINQVTNDCKQCLATLSGFIKDNGDNFYLVDNKDSFDISGQDKNSVTSYVSGYYAKKDYAQILFVGDIMFDRGIRYFAQKNGGNEFIFDKVSSLLSENDLVFGNLEGPITDNKSISSGTVPGSPNNYYFTFDPSVAETLFKEKVRLVSLGNNHILNFHNAGLASTKDYLDKSNVDYFGAPNNSRSKSEEISGVKITFIGYNYASGLSEEEEAKETIDEIKKAREFSDIVVVTPHWGVEYDLDGTDLQKALAHQFIDVGADLVIGGHPHVIEPMEIYNGKRIYYSLGNFIFDQYFDEDVRNSMGVIVKINKETKQLEFTEKYFYLDNNGQTVISPSYDNTSTAN